MSGSRSLALLAALVVAALGLTLAPASSQAALPATASVRAKVPAPPKVGTCRDYGWKGYLAVAEHSRAVSCAKQHTARVIKIGHLVKGTTWKTVASTANQRRMTQTCEPAFRKVVGGSFAKRRQTAYDIAWFAPTRRQFRAGARWFRCDVVLVGRKRLVKLPTNKKPFLADTALAGPIVACFDPAYPLGTRFSCASTHTYRAHGTFKLAGKKFPTSKALQQASSAHCPDVAGTDDWMSFGPSRHEWGAGDHIVVCYARV